MYPHSRTCYNTHDVRVTPLARVLRLECNSHAKRAFTHARVCCSESLSLMKAFVVGAVGFSEWLVVCILQLPCGAYYPSGTVCLCLVQRQTQERERFLNKWWHLFSSLNFCILSLASRTSDYVSHGLYDSTSWLLCFATKYHPEPLSSTL